MRTSLLRSAFFLARKDVQYMLRERETLLWTFVMPVFFFFFIGAATGGSSSDSPERPDPLVLETSPDAGFLADHLARRLEDSGFRLVSPDSAEAKRDLSRLVVPTGFTDSVLAGHPVTLTLKRGDKGLRGNYDGVRVQRARLTVLADLVAATETEGKPTPQALSAIAEAPKTLTLKVSRAGRRREIPQGFEQAIPGTMVMFTLLVLLTSGSTLLVIERKRGLLKRLASSPLSRASIVFGKWGGRFFLGLVQLAFAMLLGTFLFHMTWGPNPAMLAVVLFFYAALVALLGILFGSLARTEGQAVGIGVLASLLLAALGGCWWPIEVTAPWMQKLAWFLPTGWAMDALHKLVSFGAPASSVLPHVAVMILAIAAVAWVARRMFRFE